MKNRKTAEMMIRLIAAAGVICLALAVFAVPGGRADQPRRVLELADAGSVPEGPVPATPEEIGKVLDAADLPEEMEARFREGQPVWAEMTAPLPGLGLTENGILLAFTDTGSGCAALAFGFAEMPDGLRFAATADNEALGLRLGEVAADRYLLIDGQVWYADGNGICTLQEDVPQETADLLRAEYEAAGAAGGIPAVRPEGPLPDGFLSAEPAAPKKPAQKPKEKNSNNGKETAPAAPSAGTAPENPSVGTAPEAPSVGTAPEPPSVGAAPEVPSVGAESGQGVNGGGNNGGSEVAPDPYYNNTTISGGGSAFYRNQTYGGSGQGEEGREQPMPFPGPGPNPAPAP